MGPDPDISVVIPTRERWPKLARTLDQLARQRLGRVQAEVVVVDNGSEDGSWERLQRSRGETGLQPSAYDDTRADPRSERRP